MKNFFKTAFLLTLLTLLLIWLGAAIGGRVGVIVAFCFALVLNFVSYWYSDKIVLAIYRAQPAQEAEFPVLFRAVSDLAHAASVPMPKIYIIPTKTPNAFATGRDPNHAAVTVTHGILSILSEDELRGVLSHEIAHVKNRDILIQTVVATIAGAISMIAYMARWTTFFRGGRGSRGGNIIGILVMSIIAPIVAMLIQLAISRTREYQADESGARISGTPLSLANALRKLTMASKRIPMRGANPNTAHLFIVNPLSGSGLVRLFSTHPPLEDRIARLEKMAQDA
ncbi:MAG: zinc metalloprotease HtpX [Candidatus Omnitrophota bacterium]|nr:MAG: zinc metalloprotease HtpX [Candidatus Omnitrophota bacterium]